MDVSANPEGNQRGGPLVAICTHTGPRMSRFPLWVRRCISRFLQWWAGQSVLE